MIDPWLESRILSFERTWQREGKSAITAILDRSPAARGADRSRLLLELIAIDMEFRARDPRSAGPTTLDAYAARFPDLGTPDTWPVALIAEEYRVRHRWGDRPAHAEFLARFPTQSDRIRAELLRVDAELAAERTEPARPSESVVGLPLIPHEDLHLQRMIGAGRMGKVYQAYWGQCQRAVAVKFLRKTLLREARAIARFLAEAHTVARLHHPNIVGLHGLGRTPAGAYFLVLDLVAGPDLDRTVRAQPLAIDDAVRCGTQICDALEHAHEAGVVHCDLKPANILRDANGTIRVTDFGLARIVAEDAPWSAYIEGTGPFMAPEQACSSWGEIDRRTDVFGIGAVLYALLTGRPPWTGSSLAEILATVISAKPVPAAERFRPDLPSDLRNICRTCLAKRPADRYDRVADVRSALLAAHAVPTRQPDVRRP